MQKKRTVLLSTSLAWPALAGCSRAETFSQLSAISFAQPCSVLSLDISVMYERVTRTTTRVQESRSKATARRRSDNATELMLHSLPVCMKGRKNILQAVICRYVSLAEGFLRWLNSGLQLTIV